MAMLKFEALMKAMRSQPPEKFMSRAPSPAIVTRVDSSIPPLRQQWVTEYKEQAARGSSSPGPCPFVGILAELAIHSEHKDIRRSAVESVTEPALLIEIANRSHDRQVRMKAREMLAATITDVRLLYIIEAKSEHPEVRKTARAQLVKRITDQGRLLRMALESEYPEERVQAVKQITDQDFLVKIALTATSPEIKALAVERIVEPEAKMKLWAGRRSDSSLRM